MVSADPVLDLSQLAAFSCGDQRLAAEFMGLFLKNAEAYINDIEQNRDKSTLLLHKLKGAAMTVGAMRLAGLCGVVGMDTQDLRGLIEALRHELAAVQREAGVFSSP